MTSIPAVGVHIEKEHEAFPDDDPFHVHNDLGCFRLLKLTVPVATFREEVKTFPNGSLYTAATSFSCCSFDSYFHVEQNMQVVCQWPLIKNILLSAVFCVKMKESGFSERTIMRDLSGGMNR